MKNLFNPGEIVTTPGIFSFFQGNEQLTLEILNCLSRHCNGDWGDLKEEDKLENELALNEGFRLFSAYTLSNEERIWIITEADRSVTTVLLPEEY